MCVIFWAVDPPHYDLVIASNRDEFLSRPTLPAEWHDFSPSSSSSSSSGQHSILSARDATGGGTWLGITRSGAFATLTNFTELLAPLPAGMEAFESRGRLVRDWLVAQSQCERGRGMEEVVAEIEAYLGKVARKLDRYPGFNLLVGALSTEGTVVGYITNRTPDGHLATDRSPDIFTPHPSTTSDTAPPPGGMSNSVLTQPWSKVLSGSTTFRAILASAQTEGDKVEALFDLLWTASNPAPAHRAELRHSVLIPPLELPLSSEKRDWYTTRTSTVIMVRKDGSAKMVERDTFKLIGYEAALVNGPEGSGAFAGRSGGQRMFEWQI